MYPQVETSCGQLCYYFGSGWHFLRSSGQGNLWSDVPPSRHDVAKLDTTLGQVDIWSGLPVRLTFGQMNPLHGDLLWPSMLLLWVRLTFYQIFRSGWPLDRCICHRWSFGSGWHLVRLWVRLTFGQIYPSPRQILLLAKYVTTLGQVDILSDLQARLTFNKYTLRQGHLVAKYYYFRSGLLFVRSFGQVDLSSDVPPGRDILQPSVTTSVRLTFGQMYPWAETSCGQVCYYFSQVDLWSDVPPAETSCDKVCYYFSQVDLWSDVPPG